MSRVVHGVFEWYVTQTISDPEHSRIENRRPRFQKSHFTLMMTVPQKKISPRTKCEGGSPSVVKWTCPISPTYKYKRNSEFPEQTIPEIERIRKQDNPIFD